MKICSLETIFSLREYYHKGLWVKTIQFTFIALGIFIFMTGCGLDNLTDGEVKISNSKNANTNIKDIYYKKSSSTNWGRDRLENQELEPSQQKRYIINDCDKEYDFKVIYLDDKIQYENDYKINCYKTVVLVFRD